MSEPIDNKGDRSRGNVLSTRVCLIAAYFGALPTNFRVWLRTCGANASFQWLLFTDAEVDPAAVPANVSIVRMPFGELRGLIESRLGMKVCLPSPYKVCDFRPAFGVIFSDWLRGADFWGYCDLDVVWGRLAHFFTDAVFAANDRVQESGHLTFMRNTEAANTLYRRTAPHVDYRSVFTDPGVFAFDEWGGAHDLAYLYGLRRTWIRSFWEMEPSDFRFRDPIQENYRRQLFYWQDGQLYREYVDPRSPAGSFEYPIPVREEIALIHLLKRDLPAPTFDVESVRGFYVTPRGFVPKVKDEHCLQDFIRMNPQSWTYRPVGRMKRLAKGLRLRVLDWFR